MEDLVVRGAIFKKGKMNSGSFSILEDKFVDGASDADFEGTLIEAPVNFHTHLGDSFIGTEPEGTIGEIVGPNGFKIRALENAAPSTVKRSIGKSIRFMNDVGTQAFFDFRESGIKGLELAPKTSDIQGYFLTRPNKKTEILPLLDRSAGFGMSAISDYDFEYLRDLSQKAHERNKLFAIHFSEDRREDVNKLAELGPDFIVHGIEMRESDIRVIKKHNIPVSITPKSNIFHGKRPDYARLIRSGLTVLLGTDNAFITEPNIMEEAEFLYRYQRNINRLKPEEVLSTVIDNPRKVISGFGMKMNLQKYLFFPNEILTAYQLVTRPNYYEKIIVTKKGNRITFFSSKH